MRHLKESKQDELNFKNWLNNDQYADLFIKFRQGFKQPENDYYYWIKKKQPEDLVKFIDVYQDQKQAKEKEHQEVMNGAEFLGEENGYKVYYITTWEASKTLGQGAKWCISMKNKSAYWKDYTSRGIKFYFFISSQTKYALALYPKVLEINKVIDENTYLIKANFEIYDARDKLDYLIINKLPLNLIPEQIVLEKEAVENGLVIKDNKLIKVNKNIKNVNISNNVTSIGKSAFEDCISLKNITIPNSITIIEFNAFYNCKSLKNIKIPNSIIRIGGCAFEFCTSLTSIAIPDSVTSIGHSVFSNCYSLTSIVIPNSISRIEAYSFWYCYSLTSITIPDSVISIGVCAFEDCTSLKDVYYLGRESDWNKIKIEYEGNEILLNANIHFNSKNESLIESKQDEFIQIDIPIDAGFSDNPEIETSNKYNCKWFYFGNCISTVDEDEFWDTTEMAQALEEAVIYTGDKNLVDAPKQALSKNTICAVINNSIGVIYNWDNDIHYFFDIKLNESLNENIQLAEMKGKLSITEEKIITYINDCIKDLKSLGYNIDNDIDFMWGEASGTFGTMFWPDNENSNYILVLNKHMIDEPEEAIKSTIYHELAHYINNKQLLDKGIAYWYDYDRLKWDSRLYKQGIHGSHGQWWQKVVNNINSKLGTNISRTSNYQLHTGVGDYAKTKNKYMVTCKNCGNVLTYSRKTDFVKNPNESTYDFYVRKYGQSWADYIWPDEKTKQLKKNTHYWSCGRCGKSDWEIEENN